MVRSGWAEVGAAAAPGAEERAACCARRATTSDAASYSAQRATGAMPDMCPCFQALKAAAIRVATSSSESFMLHHGSGMAK